MPKYRLVIETNADGGYLGSWLEFPYVMGDGETIEACARNAQEALEGVIAHLLETGKPIPAPASDENRTEQVNIRLTAFEKARIEAMARQGGFRSISDYIRASAMSKAG